jgi:hypothetical protein
MRHKSASSAIRDSIDAPLAACGAGVWPPVTLDTPNSMPAPSRGDPHRTITAITLDVLQKHQPRAVVAEAPGIRVTGGFRGTRNGNDPAVAILPQRREIAGEPPPNVMRLWHNGW